MRRTLGFGVLLGLVSLLLLDAVLARSGLAPLLPRAEGAGPWMLSRSAAFTAYVALSLEIALGLLVSTGAADRWIARARFVELHQWLSSATLVLVGAHVLSLLGDGFAGLDALDLSVPFLAPLRRVATGLGVLSGYLLLALHVSYGMRGRIGARTWRKLHYASFALYVLATVHGISAGTDTGRPFATTLYVVSAAVVTALVAARIASAQQKQTALRAASAPPTLSHGPGIVRGPWVQPTPHDTTEPRRTSP